MRTTWKVAIHRISTGDSLVVGEYPTLSVATIMRDEIEKGLFPLWYRSLAVYILPVDGN